MGNGRIKIERRVLLVKSPALQRSPPRIVWGPKRNSESKMMFLNFGSLKLRLRINKQVVSKDAIEIQFRHSAVLDRPRECLSFGHAALTIPEIDVYGLFGFNCRQFLRRLQV